MLNKAGLILKNSLPSFSFLWTGILTYSSGLNMRYEYNESEDLGSLEPNSFIYEGVEYKIIYFSTNMFVAACIFDRPVPFDTFSVVLEEILDTSDEETEKGGGMGTFVRYTDPDTDEVSDTEFEAIGLFGFDSKDEVKAKIVFSGFDNSSEEEQALALNMNTSLLNTNGGGGEV